MIAQVCAQPSISTFLEQLLIQFQHPDFLSSHLPSVILNLMNLKQSSGNLPAAFIMQECE